MQRIPLTLLILLELAPACAPRPAADANAAAAPRLEPAGPRLCVLALGDRGHHAPAARLQEAWPALAHAGVSLEYEADLARITPERLAAYDVVMVYANFAEHAAAPESFLAALTTWVRGGGGLAAIHCASACFPQSPEWTALVGARFDRHGGEEFSDRIVAPEHPLLAGYVPFTSWDETYVHREHAAAGRAVLTERDGEPWTWVREEGSGRVFYTAWGHDARTWSQPGFHDLLARGLRWAAGAAADARTRGFALPPLTHEPRETIPNYEKRDPAPGYQLPLAPADAQRHLIPSPGLRAELFAAEPDVVNPIAFSFDARGRLWVLESVDYPNDLEPDGVGRDRLKICEDRDGDGRADSFVIFAEGLNVPTGVLCVDGGALVAQAPDLLWLRDADGDDRCDGRERILSGFGRSDTHAGPSSLTWGPDGRVWGAVGYAGYRSGSLGFGQGLWRVGRDGAGLEFVAQFTNNTWGLGFREDGELFGGTANGAPTFLAAVPKPLLAAVDAQHPGAAPIHDFTALHPATLLRQVDFFGGYTAAAGHRFLESPLFPAWMQGEALVCEPTGHLVARLRLRPDGSGWRAHDGWNLIASTDEWFAPVQAEVGPDGAVWIADFAEFIVQHNPTPTPEWGGFAGANGAGNAHENPLRDRERGRIWRVLPTGAQPPPPRDLERANLSQLLAALGDPNPFWRVQAQRRIAERHGAAGAPAVLASLERAPSRAQCLGALAALRALGAAPPATLLRHADPAVRRAAYAALPAERASAQALLDANALLDPDGAARRHALLAAARLRDEATLGAALAAVATRAEFRADPWLSTALLAAAAAHADAFLAALGGALAAEATGADSGPGPNLIPNSGFEEADPGDASTPRAWRPRTYSGSSAHHWVAGAGRDGSRALRCASAEGSDTSWFVDVPVEPNVHYRLTGWVRGEGLDPIGQAMGALLNLHARADSVTDAVRDSDVWRQVTLEFTTGPQERSVSLNCLFGGWGQSRGAALYDDLELRSVGRSAPLGSMAARVARALGRDAAPQRVGAYLEQVESGRAVATRGVLESLAAGWSARTEARDPAVEARLQVLAGADLGALARAAAGRPLTEGGNAAAGEVLFRTHAIAACAACHKVGDLGGAVGPDLTRVGGRLSREQILQSILDPNAALAEGWPSEVSAMPVLRPFLQDQEIRDLVAYLAGLR